MNIKSSSVALRYYLKTTAWLLALFASVAIVFLPIMPSVLNLLGCSSFFGISFSGLTERTYVNVLLMGLDKEETRSDVMMVAQLNLDANSINVLQIPRDTYINNQRGDKKINSAYGAGGVEKSIEEVETLVDLDIDKYAIVTTTGFRDVIDAVGGIYYDIPQDMNYDDPLQDLHIHLKKGYQLLDGDKAEQYVRCRYIYPTGDIGRVEAQSDFLKEAFSQVTERYKSGGDINTQKLITILGDMVDTNFTLEEMLKYAPYLLNVDLESLNIMMLAGYPEYRNNVSYFIANESKNAQIIKEYFTPAISEADLSEIKARDEAVGKNHTEHFVSDAPITNISPSEINVFIYDYSSTQGQALSKAENTLEELGYRIVGSVVASTATADKTYCVSSWQSQLSSVVAKDLELKYYHINPDYSNQADVVLVLGKDF